MKKEKRGMAHDDVGFIEAVSYRRPKHHIKIYAEKKRSVLIIGPTGVGKELLANLYANYAKRDIEIVNCAAAPSDTFLISEVFGHMKGSYTGANRDRLGLLETSKGKVLFLDELGDASKGFQALILRVIEYGDYKRLGEDKWNRRVENILFIAATNKINNVRADLRNRFESEVEVSPLAFKDIPHFVEYFLNQHSHVEYITEGALYYLAFYSWPNNIRELKNTIRQAADMVEGRAIKAQVLPDKCYSDDVKRDKLRKQFESAKKVKPDKVKDWFKRNLKEEWKFEPTVSQMRKKTIERLAEIRLKKQRESFEPQSDSDPYSINNHKTAREEFLKQWFHKMLAKYPDLSDRDIAEKVDVAPKTISAWRRKFKVN